MKYSKLSKRPSHFKRYTGFSVAEFNKLAQEIRPIWEKAELKRLFKPNRQRRIGAGRKSKLPTLEDKLTLVLVFYRLYLSSELLGYLFCLDKSNISRQLRMFELVLAKRIKLPRLSKKKISTIDDLLKIYPEIEEYIGDATEQEIPRPRDKRKRKKFYSGKKKRHTIKTQIIIKRNNGNISDISQSIPGSIHDYQLFHKSKIPKRLPKKVPIYLDKGYDGVKKDYPELNVFMPKKANRWHNLTLKDKKDNKELNKIRVKVEHSILKCKRFKVLHQIYRHPLKDLKQYNQRFKIIAGLVNFKLQNSFQETMDFNELQQPLLATV